jgi:hypothetical protein
VSQVSQHKVCCFFSNAVHLITAVIEKLLISSVRQYSLQYLPRWNALIVSSQHAYTTTCRHKFNNYEIWKWCFAVSTDLSCVISKSVHTNYLQLHVWQISLFFGLVAVYEWMHLYLIKLTLLIESLQTLKVKQWTHIYHSNKHRFVFRNGDMYFFSTLKISLHTSTLHYLWKVSKIVSDKIITQNLCFWYMMGT